MANMPKRFTARPSVLTSNNWLVFISGGFILSYSQRRVTLRMLSTHSLSIASKTMKIEMRIKKTPLEKPERVSIRP